MIQFAKRSAHSRRPFFSGQRRVAAAFAARLAATAISQA